MLQHLSDKNFEQQKNIKAAIITLIIAVCIFFIFITLSWQLPQLPPPIVEEGIEVNLGNSDFGMGNVEPQVIGSPTNEVQQTYSPPPPPSNPPPSNSEPVDEADDEDVSPAKTNAIPTPIITKPTIKPTKPTPTIPTKTQTVSKPKAVFGGAKNPNNGGNNADSYNGVKSQGITKGNANQGNPNGNPNSDSYQGNASAGNSSIKVKSGLNGRKITKLPNFEDEFNENAKVSVDITVDANGSVTSAVVSTRSTTTTNASIRRIAINKAKQLKFTAGDDEQSGTIVINFVVKN